MVNLCLPLFDGVFLLFKLYALTVLLMDEGVQQLLFKLLSILYGELYKLLQISQNNLCKRFLKYVMRRARDLKRILQIPFAFALKSCYFCSEPAEQGGSVKCFVFVVFMRRFCSTPLHYEPEFILAHNAFFMENLGMG